MAEESVRYLSRADVETVGLTGADVIEILDAAFRAKRDGAIEMPPKILLCLARIASEVVVAQVVNGEL